jgi:hypothetical protein
MVSKLCAHYGELRWLIAKDWGFQTKRKQINSRDVFCEDKKEMKYHISKSFWVRQATKKKVTVRDIMETCQQKFPNETGLNTSTWLEYHNDGGNKDSNNNS